MASTLQDDILIIPGNGNDRPVRSRIAAFVPITIAVIGVAAILLGRVTVHEVAPPGTGPNGVDPITTGSIVP